MRLSSALKEKLMDVRLREKLVTEGKITRDEVLNFLNNLDDDNSRVTNIEDNTKKEDTEETVEEVTE